MSRDQWWADLSAKQDRERKTFADAVAVVSMFNAHMAGRSVALFYPVIGVALLAKYHWVRIACDSCDSITELDLQMKPRNPHSPICAVLRDVHCARCIGHGRPRIVGLAKFSS